MNHLKELNLRLTWMDVLRGVLILFVVLGHATGKYNMYIYQFHMGAFFFVSGYMSRQETKGVLEILYHRTMTTLLPLCSAILLLLGITSVLNLTQTYSIFFAEAMPYVGIAATIKEFLLYGNIYVWWLGAAWFIVVLFAASIFNRMLLKLCADQHNIWYALLITGCFLLGYVAIQRGLDRWDLDLILIANFYYGLGALAKCKHHLWQMIANKKFVCCVLCLICALIMVMIIPQFRLTMDYPSRGFNNPIVDAAIVLNGLCCTFFLAVLLDCIPWVNTLLRYLGKNTLPIVLFHFMWFELGFYILYLFDVVPFAYIQNFVPTADIGNKYWPLFLLVGVVGSILFWRLLTTVKLFRILFGQEKDWYSAIYQKIFTKKADEAKQQKISVIAGARAFFLKGVLIVVALLLIVNLAYSVMSGKNEMQHPGSTSEEVADSKIFPALVTMPYTTENPELFKSGWHPQSMDEAYRWVRQESIVQLTWPASFSQLVLEGYIPDSFTEINHITVYLGDTVVYDAPVCCGSSLNISQDLSGVQRSSNSVEVKIEFNAEHVPQAGVVDQRIMSALITKVGFLNAPSE